MKSMDELRSRFDDIQDLPVSEEMIGAYAEGVLSPTEMSDIDAQLGDDSLILQVANETQIDAIDELIGLGTSTSVLDGIEDWLSGHPISTENTMEIPEGGTLSMEFAGMANSNKLDGFEGMDVDDIQGEDIFSEKFFSTGDSSEFDSDSLKSDSSSMGDYDEPDFDI